MFTETDITIHCNSIIEKLSLNIKKKTFELGCHSPSLDPQNYFIKNTYCFIKK